MAGSTLSDLSLRRASSEDAPQLAQIAVAGFESWRAFAPPDWSGPTLEEESERVARTLAKASAWCELAADRAGVAGHAGWLAAADARDPVPDPGLAHLWQLFVRRDRWGSGLAARLHAAAIEAAARRSFTVMRLYTPAEHGRARRFYEREGWRPHRGPFDDEALGMPVVEYRRELLSGNRAYARAMR